MGVRDSGISVEDRYEQLRDDVVDLIDAVECNVFTVRGVLSRLHKVVARDDARRRVES